MFVVEKKYRWIILVLLVSGIIYLLTGMSKIFIATSIAVVIIYFYFYFTEDYSEVKFSYTGEQLPYNDLFMEEQNYDKINDPNIKEKIFNNWNKILWDRNWDVKNTSPFGFCSEPTDSVEFAEWCYGLKPEVTGTNEYDKTIRIKDTCKNGSIYMNNPEKSSMDRISCKGHM